MVTDQQVFDFLTGQTIHVFDPNTGERVARADYHADGTVRMQHADGRRDQGTWGVDGGMYWTQYQHFRDGTRNRFYLELLDDDTAQAYFSDGRPAFLQSHNPTGPGAA